MVLLVKNPPTNAGDTRNSGLFPGSGKSPKVGGSNPLQYFCLENSMNRGAWWVTVHAPAKSQTWLSAYIYVTVIMIGIVVNL